MKRKRTQDERLQNTIAEVLDGMAKEADERALKLCPADEEYERQRRLMMALLDYIGLWHDDEPRGVWAAGNSGGWYIPAMTIGGRGTAVCICNLEYARPLLEPQEFFS